MVLLCADTHSQQPTSAPPGGCGLTALLYVSGVLCSLTTPGLGHALHSPWLPVHFTSSCRVVDSLWTQLRPLLCYLFPSTLRRSRQPQKGMNTWKWNLPEFVDIWQKVCFSNSQLCKCKIHWAMGIIIVWIWSPSSSQINTNFKRSSIRDKSTTLNSHPLICYSYSF